MKITRTASHKKLFKKAGSYQTTIVPIDRDGREVEVTVNYEADRYVPATWDSPDEGGGISIDSVIDNATGEDITNSVSQIDFNEYLPEAISQNEADGDESLRDEHYENKFEEDRLERTKPMRGRTGDYKLPYSADDTWDGIVNDTNSGELGNKRKDYLNDQFSIEDNKNKDPKSSPSNAKFEQLFNKDKKKQPAFARSENNMKVLKTSSYKKLAEEAFYADVPGESDDSASSERYSFIMSEASREFGAGNLVQALDFAEQAEKLAYDDYSRDEVAKAKETIYAKAHEGRIDERQDGIAESEPIPEKKPWTTWEEDEEIRKKRYEIDKARNLPF